MSSSGDSCPQKKTAAALPPPQVYGNVLASGEPPLPPSAYPAEEVVSVEKGQPGGGTVVLVRGVDAAPGKDASPCASVSPGRDTFMMGLCKSGGPCCEALCCYHCQLSRQYNMLVNKHRGRHCGVCCLLWCLDWWSFLSFGKGLQCFLRGRLRQRYHLGRDGCGDCCVVCWCACCALSQTHWEMAFRGDNPGSSLCCGGVNLPAEMR